MSRHSTDLPTCYVGVSFYRTPDGEELHTAVAQVFNERGDGVVVRGGTAKISKTERRPHPRDRRAETAQRRARRIPPHPRPPVRPHCAAQDLAVQRSGGQRIPGRRRRAGHRPRSCCGSSAAARRICSAPGSSRRCGVLASSSMSTASCCIRAGRSPTSAPTPACTSPSRSSSAPPQTAPTCGTRQRPSCRLRMALMSRQWRRPAGGQWPARRGLNRIGTVLCPSLSY